MTRRSAAPLVALLLVGLVGCSDSESASGTDCPAGLVDCDGECVDTGSDAENCDDCGIVCPAGSVCSLGQCGATCAVNETLCGTSCVDLIE